MAKQADAATTFAVDAQQENQTQDAAETQSEVEKETSQEKVVSKSLFDKQASELAQIKRKFREKMTQDEANAAEQADKDAELATLKRENAMSKIERALIAAEFDGQRAAKIAEAIYDADGQSIVQEIIAYRAEFKKLLQADALKNTPKPPVGGASSEKKIEQPVRKADDITNLYK